MTQQSNRDAVVDALQRINRTWLEGRPRELVPLLHPAVVMVLPGFRGRIEGRDAFIGGFVEFCENAAMEEYAESDLQIDITDQTAVATYSFEMLYERDGNRYHSTGRDLWVFTRRQDSWLAVWRTMFDLTERPA